MKEKHIELNNIGFSYSRGNLIFDYVSLKLNKGESIAIIGGNGAGKTTLLMLLTGILFPQTGEISISNQPIKKENLQNILQQTGVIFQNPDDQLFMPTVFEELAFAPRNFKFKEAKVHAMVFRALARVEGLHLQDKLIYQLSGGEKRQVAIATALVMNPSILIMDEPSSGLDLAGRRRLIDLIKNFKQTKIIATHDLDMALEVCNRVIIIGKGKVIADGKSYDILTNEKLLKQNNLELPISVQNCHICGFEKK
ncbi:MAG TPA: ABC transporter ATP-binding protein [Burkholderiales bacterium]|nr:ABC transporter ATP-binding protein [Burkholderiales bacterium]